MKVQIQKNSGLLDAFNPEPTTVWSFPIRGDWATHSPSYRGNFAPQVARNLILKYSKKGDLVIDPMVGSGTTLIEARLLERNAIGIDINQNAVDLSNKAIGFQHSTKTKQKAILGNACSLKTVKPEVADLLVLHPPYFNIVKYSNGENKEDLSSLSNLGKFYEEMGKVASECYRLLKPNKYCAVLIGDTRKMQHYIPISYNIMVIFMQAGFILKEEIIKTQHNCKYSDRWRDRAGMFGFHLIMHEHLYVFRKPAKDEDLKNFKWSMAGAIIKK